MDSSSVIQSAIDEIATMTSPAAVSVVIRKVITHPDAYFFGRLLQLPAVKNMESDAQFAHFVQVLHLLCFGSLADLASQPPAVQELFRSSTTLQTKLKRLTLISLCSQARRVSYKDIRTHTGILDTRELEDLIIDTITEGLLKARIDQKEAAVDVFQVTARDVNLQDSKDLDRMIRTIETWVGNCTASETDLGSVPGQLQKEDLKRQEQYRAFKEKEIVVIEACRVKALESRETAAGTGLAGAMGIVGRGDPRGGSAGNRRRVN